MLLSVGSIDQRMSTGSSGAGKVVCVTGASGYIASWLVKLLLEKGDPRKTGHLLSLSGAKDRLHLFKADLLDEGSFDGVVEGCDGVFHTASPCHNNIVDPQAEMLDPAVKGTLNVLRSCAKVPSVKRVILTSSIAAVVYNGRPLTPDVVVDETWFSDPEICRKLKAWYMLSKTLAEEAAWNFTNEKGIDMVVINPAVVIGPLLQPTLNTGSSEILNLLNGSEIFDDMPSGWVNVRDVVEAHVKAFEAPSARGRYCLVESTTHTSEIVEILMELYPSLRLPRKRADQGPVIPKCKVSKERAKSLGIESSSYLLLLYTCMAISAFFSPSLSLSCNGRCEPFFPATPPKPVVCLRITAVGGASNSLSLRLQGPALFFALSSSDEKTLGKEEEEEGLIGGGGGDGGGYGGHGGRGGGRDGNDGEWDDAGERNRKEAMMVVAEAGRTLESLASALAEGKIPAAVALRYLDMEKSGFLRWLMQFGGFKERLLADDLFLAKVGMECGVGIFTKTAAEYDRRRENFFNELEIVFADVVMAIIADFMLVYLPAPTVAIRPALATNAGTLAKFFHNCPDNAFQIALPGTSHSFLQRLGAIARNGSKLFAVGTTSSLVGTAATNALINARKAVDKSSAGEVENVPILSTSAAYGVYMAISSNLRYQVLAGVIEQRILEPLLHRNKVMLSATCFTVRTGNTYLGSLLWVDYARWIGIQ
ncbi:hypothetical protein MLD38_011764 [Melastoma candidum]|uniref:Uncharacterized protein n=1 Tax=Melastoma candidum TaxID=119954 RepID=A0ACB9R5V2_9MYRT|nr:hypothetical protein MLD38_011764 [Melastoma candidum]